MNPTRTTHPKQFLRVIETTHVDNVKRSHAVCSMCGWKSDGYNFHHTAEAIAMDHLCNFLAGRSSSEQTADMLTTTPRNRSANLEKKRIPAKS
jgi:hypothetical protein